MSNQRIYKTRDFITVLNKNGLNLVRIRGDHGIFSNGKNSIAITIKGKEINRMIARRLIKENGFVM